MVEVPAATTLPEAVWVATPGPLVVLSQTTVLSLERPVQELKTFSFLETQAKSSEE